jgi:hypothetical protein
MLRRQGCYICVAVALTDSDVYTPRLLKERSHHFYIHCKSHNFQESKSRIIETPYPKRSIAIGLGSTRARPPILGTGLDSGEVFPFFLDTRQIETNYGDDPGWIKIVLSDKDPNVLLLTGILVDQLELATTTYRSNDTVQLQEWFPDWKGDFRCAGGPNGKNFKLNAVIGDFLRRCGHQVPAFQRIEAFVEKMNSASLKEYSFVMTTPGFKGFVRGEPRIGDTIFETYGSRFPLVLRRRDEEGSRYSFVGCAIIEEAYGLRGDYNDEGLEIRGANHRACVAFPIWKLSIDEVEAFHTNIHTQFGTIFDHPQLDIKERGFPCEDKNGTHLKRDLLGW